MSKISAEKMAQYRATAQRRWSEHEAQLATRKKLAWDTARQAAQLLRETFKADEVILFGSLAHGDWFTLSSDIDLAASGIAAEHYLSAVAQLQDLSPLFNIDLVDLNRCKPELLLSIQKEGKEL